MSDGDASGAGAPPHADTEVLHVVATHDRAIFLGVAKLGVAALLTYVALLSLAWLLSVSGESPTFVVTVDFAEGATLLTLAGVFVLSVNVIGRRGEFEGNDSHLLAEISSVERVICAGGYMAFVVSIAVMAGDFKRMEVSIASITLSIAGVGIAALSCLGSSSVGAALMTKVSLPRARARLTEIEEERRGCSASPSWLGITRSWTSLVLRAVAAPIVVSVVVCALVFDSELSELLALSSAMCVLLAAVAAWVAALCRVARLTSSVADALNAGIAVIVGGCAVVSVLAVAVLAAKNGNLAAVAVFSLALVGAFTTIVVVLLAPLSDDADPTRSVRVWRIARVLAAAAPAPPIPEHLDRRRDREYARLDAFLTKHSRRE